MNAKEFLNRAYMLDQRINTKLHQAEYLRSLAQKITATYGGETVSHSRNMDSMSDAIAKLVDTENAMNEEINQLIETRMQISNVIAQVRNETYRLILEKRYLEFIPLEQIAADMDYGIRWLYKVHNRALDVVGRILENEKAS